MRYLSARLRVVAATVFVLATSTLATAPAHASTVIDCTQGTVTLSPYLADYDLVGACSTVIIEGTNNTVRLQSAEVLLINSTQATVTASGRLSKIVVNGAQPTITVSSVGSITVHAILARLTADKVGTLSVRSGSATVAVGQARRLLVTGASAIGGRFTFDRLSRVIVTKLTDHNKIRVRKGVTRVTDTGRHNVIRVHQRARS